MKKILALILVLVMALGLCACSNEQDGGTPPDGSTPPASTGNTPGDGENGGGTGDTIKIGAVYPASGVFGIYGEYCYQGALMAAQEINDNGGIDGKRVEIITADDQGDASMIAGRLSELKAQGAVAIVGPMLDTESPAAGAWARENETLVICGAQFSATASVQDASDYYYCSGASIWPMAKIAAQAAKDMGVKSIYYIGPDGEVPTDTYNFIWEALEGSGIEDAGCTIKDMNDTDFTTIITAAMAKNPDLIINYSNGTTWTSFLQQAADLGITEECTILGFSVLGASTTKTFGESHPDGIYSISELPVGNESFEKHKEDFRKFSGGMEANESSIHYYNAVKSIAAALDDCEGNYSGANVAAKIKDAKFETCYGTEASYDKELHVMKLGFCYGVGKYDASLGYYVLSDAKTYTDEIYPTHEEFLKYAASIS